MHDLTIWVSRIMPSQHEKINHKMALYKTRALYILRTCRHSTQNKEGVRASCCLQPELHVMELSLLLERRGSGFSLSGPHIPIFPGPFLQCFMLQYHWTYSSQNAYCWWCHKSSNILFLLPSVICSVPCATPVMLYQPSNPTPSPAFPDPLPLWSLLPVPLHIFHLKAQQLTCARHTINQKCTWIYLSYLWWIW